MCDPTLQGLGLDYGDVIYHILSKVCEFSQNITLPILMEKLESVQYSAALTVTGTWRGTSRNKLYAELSWKSLSSRRLSRRLTLFYNKGRFFNAIASVALASRQSSAVSRVADKKKFSHPLILNALKPVWQTLTWCGRRDVFKESYLLITQKET